MQSSSFSIKDDLALAGRLADAARGPALAHFRRPLDIDNKHAATGGFDPVTTADRGVEQTIRAILAEERPDDGVLGEEFGVTEGAGDRRWILDPIDGTRAYISGAPTWGVLIGLYRGDTPILGVMDQPFTGERFSAADGQAVWSQGGETRPLRTRPCGDLSTATIMTTDPDLFTSAERPAFDHIANAAQLRRYSLDCYAYALIAAGGVDVVIESGLSAYDIAALIPIVEAAGGRVTSWTGGSAAGGGRVLASGDPRLHDQLLQALASV